MSNKWIIDTGIYYYDIENITKSNLAFCKMVDKEIEYKQSNQRDLDSAYGIFTENSTEVSTEIVLPQQQDWWKESVEQI
ncbi:hypothetical protein LPJ64_006310, partial [Coemansia asiatica]